MIAPSPPADIKNCQHMNFKTICKVIRLTDVEGGPVTGYAADINIYCADCKMPFQFLGVKVGCIATEPTTDVAGSELRIPIKPGVRGD